MPEVSSALRTLVARRAGYLCEYCLIHEEDTWFGCQVDHIVSLKHGGPSVSDNLAYACGFCNRFKGSDLGSISEITGQLTPFFNPRTAHWAHHFVLRGALILPISATGEVTVRIFGFNSEEQVLERQALIGKGRYPSAAAAARIKRRD
jgi:hypothetical protein